MTFEYLMQIETSNDSRRRRSVRYHSLRLRLSAK